jgi:thiol-disulfide isomerase/thioredoxin
MGRLFVGCMVWFWVAGSLAGGVHAQAPQVYHAADLQALLDQDNDTLYILNFWATWCRPCVAEMPHFDQVQQEMAGQKVKVVFLSLDFKSDVESRLVPFLKRKKLHSTVVFLDEPNLNDWADAVSKEWSGAIPATLFVRNQGGIRHFHEGDFTYESLISTINTLLSSPEK